MFHYISAITNTKGDALIGYYVAAIDTSSNVVVPIYADESGTPVEVVSGIANKAKIDADGNASFYVAPGTYHLDLFAPDGMTAKKRVRNLPMTLGASFLNGTDNPGAGVGSNGDFYIKTGDSPTLFGPKSGGAWPAGVPLVGSGGGGGGGNGDYKLTDFRQGGDADWGVTLNRALAALYAEQVNSSGTYRGMPRLRIPAGRYEMGSAPIVIRGTALIEGEGPAGLAGGYGTVLNWAAGSTGFVLPRFNTTTGHAIVANTFGADGTILRGLRLTADGSYALGAAEKHAIEMHCRAVIEDCSMFDWRGDGINILATAGAGAGGNEGNANCFEVRRCFMAFCRNGLFTAGADANAGLVELVDASSNRLWGISEGSFLGNTYVACHTAGNLLGAYGGAPGNGTNTSVFDGCYSEGGQNPSQFGPLVEHSGQHGAGIDPANPGIYRGGNTAGQAVLRTRLGAAFISTDSAGYYNFISATGANNLIWGTADARVATLASAANFGLVYNLDNGGIHRFAVSDAAALDIDSTGLSMAAGKGLSMAGQTTKGLLTMTQAAYDALGTKDPNTFYFIS